MKSEQAAAPGIEAESIDNGSTAPIVHQEGVL